jgi:polar amino acid transport system substrate-binding protein
MTLRLRRTIGLMATVLLILSACSSGSGASPSAEASSAPSTVASIGPSVAASATAAAPSIAVPAAITTAGKVVWCVDVSYPPEESYKADGTTAEGSDIDIATEIGTRFGVTSQIDNTSFTGIIASLKTKKCDLIISGMNDTSERQKEVDFVDYLKVGQGLLVKAGNPKGIHALEDLSGKPVAVQLGTTNKDALDAENVKLKAAGKAEIDIQTFDQDTDAFQQLAIGRVDAYSGDSPVCAYYAAKPENAGKYEVGGTPIDPAPIGIAIRKEDTDLKAAVQAAIDAMYADGTMKSIVDKWGMTDAVVLLK